MKLYTRTGDDGTTGLFGDQRVAKDDLRVEAYGCVDELNSHIGLALAACQAGEIRQTLVQLQSRLFDLGADLATPASPNEPDDKDRAKGFRIDQRHIDEVEGWIDRACEGLPEMKHFILPGGTELASRLHVARTVCRRAERECVRLRRVQTTGDGPVVYLNRVSDLLFALARRANHLAGVADTPWLGRGQR
ncbi:MAG: cob(I)yrinic acid a,c-diamide adenosyltransferase [Phycisphaera sp.]|nr:cob(I)yrinic acid a,c-diamide adenosyltransferase [Phycisphaera sp.]